MRCSAALCAFILGCGSDRTHDGTQIGDEGESGCDPVSEAPLSDLAAIPAGWTASPADLLAGLDEPRAGTLAVGASSGGGQDTAAEVTGGDEYAASIQGSYDASGAMWVEEEDADGLACPPYVRVPGAVAFTSDAATFTASGDWAIDGDNPPWISADVAQAEVSGSLEPPFPAGDGDEVSLGIWAVFDGGPWTASLTWASVPASGSYAQEEPLGQFASE